jgi:hypothetical protein
MNNKNIIIKCATSEDIDAICNFEKQARITEPGILYWEVNEKEYKEKLTLMNLEELHNAKIIFLLFITLFSLHFKILIVYSILDKTKLPLTRKAFKLSCVRSGRAISLMEHYEQA